MEKIFTSFQLHFLKSNKTIMKNKILLISDKPIMRTGVVNLGKLGTTLYIILVAVFLAGCSKDVVKDPSAVDPIATAAIATTSPANLAEAVVINPVVGVTFTGAVSPSEVSASSITLTQGTTPVQGTVSVSGATAIFTPEGDLKPNSKYTATVKTSKKGSSSEDGDNKEVSWSFQTGDKRGANTASVVSVLPMNNATSVEVAVQPTVTFSQVMTASAINSTTITLKQGTTTVAGSVSYSGKIATFKPASNLTADMVYTGTVTFGAKTSGGGDDDESDDNSNSKKLSNNFTWSFTTGAGSGGGVDVVAPTVQSVLPANNATSAAVNGKVTVTFSEAMTASTISSTTVRLMQGMTPVAGTVSYSGTTATFTPGSSLAVGTVYTGTVTTGAKDLAGNALAANYTWSFTTGTATTDVTPPTVTTTFPASGATSVAITGMVTATFSEAMNASTITSSTFTVSQGATAVAGTVSYSRTTATFAPSSSLVGGMVYTATITTGATDVAGNAIAASKVWSFTTLGTVAAGLSFAKDVVPVLGQCEACHTHGWTPSTVASTYYTNLVSAGYVNPTNYTSSKIYSKLSSGHPGSSNVSTADTDKIINWMKEGSKNN
jgi:hypothetical protein